MKTWCRPLRAGNSRMHAVKYQECASSSRATSERQLARMTWRKRWSKPTAAAGSSSCCTVENVSSWTDEEWRRQNNEREMIGCLTLSLLTQPVFQCTQQSNTHVKRWRREASKMNRMRVIWLELIKQTHYCNAVSWYFMSGWVMKEPLTQWKTACSVDPWTSYCKPHISSLQYSLKTATMTLTKQQQDEIGLSFAVLP